MSFQEVSDLNIKNYTVLMEEEIAEVNGKAYLLTHDKTKARVLLVCNDDTNKVFNIGFRTPPTDDTGVAHITEHSVLCGSKKFPAKDPFVELAKGSLNTFLNAMTYPDKTVYPIASVNDKDFHNLMEVYLDAVFYPNTYSNDKILKQEGWHYHLENAEDAITYNGVVYNEMKGAYSSAEQQLFDAIQTSLLPDTTYGCDSGGNPASIPDLTYEDFLAFHKKYYHPSNSYIYLYGDVDVEKELAFIDEEYLSQYDYLQVDSEIVSQPAFDEVKEVTMYYPLSETEEEEANTYFSYNVVIGEKVNRITDLTAMILDYALMDVPGAPIRKAVVDAGISNDVFSSYDNSMLQPMYSIVAKGCKTADKAHFVQVVEETLSSLIRDGLEEKMIQAALNHFEFKYKEANYGRYPKGLMYGLKAFNSWLYDDNDPFMYLRYNKEFEELKSLIGTDYYTGFLKERILDNTHKTILVGLPKKGLNKEIENEIAKKLAAYKESLSPDEIDRIVKQTKELEAYQSQPSTKEELEKIPLLELEDIGTKAQTLKNRQYECEGIPIVQHDILTNDIAYVDYHFILNDVSVDLLQYVSLLTLLYKEVDTDKRTYNELANEIDLLTGGIGVSISSISVKPKLGDYKVYLTIRTKVLNAHLPSALELMEEILFTSHITDKKRMKEVLAEVVSQMKMSIMDSGHTAMANRAKSYFSQSAYVKELIDGIGFYEFLNALNKDFDAKYEEICEKLSLALRAFAKKENLIVSYTGLDDITPVLSKALISLKQHMTEENIANEKQELDITIKNEGFKTASKVQYAAMAGRFMENGESFPAALNVLQVIFSYDYLWIQVRVKGGAYGCMCGFSRTGEGSFTSYRDPNLTKTYNVYKACVDYVKAFDASERDMLKYIIGAIAKLDTPMAPSAEGAFSFLCYLSGITQEELQADRDQILATDVKAIRALAPYMERLLSCGCIAALGDEDVIEREKTLFDEIKTLN